MTTSSATANGTRFFGRIASAIVGAYRMAWNIDPIWCGLMLLVAGLLVLVASFPLHVAFVRYPMPDGQLKQVGFFAAFNWSFVLAAIFPAAIFMMLVTVRRLNKSLEQLGSHHMLAQHDWKPATPAQITALIDRVWRGATPIGLFFFFLGLAVMGWDYWASVAGPLFSDHMPLQPGQTDIEFELDWSISALFSGLHSPDRLPTLFANEVFSTAAYILMSLETAIILSFYGFLVGVSKEIYALYDQRRNVLLTPNAADRDSRRGFQLFEGFFKGVLWATFLGYVACYLMRIQNLYLRDNNFHRLDEIVFQPISQAFKFPDVPSFQNIVDFLFQSISDLLGAVFQSGDWGDTQAYLGAITILLVFLLVTGSLFAILRTAAAESRNTLQLALDNKKNKAAIERYYGLRTDTIAKHIAAENMDIWPLKWPKVNGFFAILCLGFACFIFYRLALVWIALQLWPLLHGRHGAK